MGEQFFELLRDHFQEYGYWTVAIALLLENAGVPVPGETILLFASFLAFSEKQLHLFWIMVVGTLACTIGDNCGYLIGYRGGRPLLNRWKHIFRVRDSHIEHGERLFARFGSFTIFFARFIFGLRIIAGPLAGVLRMPWKQFFLFNFLGAAGWVMIISTTGYMFGSNWEALVRTLRNAHFALLLVLLIAGLVWWLARRRRASQR